MSDTTDEDLMRQLMCFGEDVGPLNPTTRKYWEKRLAQLKQPKKPVTRSTKSTKPQTRSSMPAVPIRTCKKQTSRIEENSVEMQQSDKELVDALKKFGIKVCRGPLNDELRIQYQKKLDRLVPEAKNEMESKPSEQETRDDLKDPEITKVIGVQLPLARRRLCKRHASQDKFEEAGTSCAGLQAGNNGTTPAPSPGRTSSFQNRFSLIDRFTDDELIKRLEDYGVIVPSGPLDAESKAMYKKVLCTFISESCD